MKQKMRGTSVPVLDFLGRQGGAATLLPAARRLIDLRQDVLALMPAALRGACEVTGDDRGVLQLRVASAGVAAKLRQTLPRIERGMTERGWQVSSIQVRVQPNAGPDDFAPAPRRSGVPMSAKGVDAFATLERSLADSPLRDAVHRLLGRRS